MFDNSPVRVTGLVAPVAVTALPEDGVAVTEKDVASGDPAGKLIETVEAPLLNALAVPTFTAESMIGCFGSRKSFC